MTFASAYARIEHVIEFLAHGTSEAIDPVARCSLHAHEIAKAEFP